MIIDGIFDPFLDLLDKFEPEIKLIVSAIIGVIGLALVVKPVAKGMSAISNKEWVSGIVWILAAVVVVAIAIGGIVFVYNMGEEGGDNMKDELGYRPPIEQPYVKDSANI